ncbi:MAG: bifunctional DNA primase/polymerase [Chloroflexi bacterium]|nr:bifunctional DNA primase/polymerase [Chloroflexota bacterium]
MVPSYPAHPHNDDPFLSAALAYARTGWAVIPLRGKAPAIPKREGGTGYKDATRDEATIRVWWWRWPQANIGIATRASGLLVLDVDPRHEGDERLRDLEHIYGRLPDTVEAITGDGGRHVYFGAPSPDTVVRAAAQLGEGLDLPNHVVAPPSVHPATGKRYIWETSSDPEDVRLADTPGWLATAAGSQDARPSQRAAPLPQVIAEGVRNLTLTSLAGSLRQRGVSESEILASLSVVNESRCAPPLPVREVQAIAQSVARYEGGQPWRPRHRRAPQEISVRKVVVEA